MVDFRLDYVVRAQRLKYNAYNFGGSDWSTLLIPTSITTNGTSDSAYTSETITDYQVQTDLERTWILPVAFDRSIIDGDIFANIRCHLTSPTSAGYSQLEGAWVNIKTIDSGGTQTSISGGDVQIFDGTLQVGYTESTTKYYQIFGWIPVSDELIEPDVRVLVYTKLQFDETSTNGGRAGMDYGIDQDETFFKIPFV